MHSTIVETTLVWPTETHAGAWARSTAQALRAAPDRLHAQIHLHGGLGAGKTTLVRHLLRALGVSGRIKSPTYALMESYELPMGMERGSPVPAWHFDFYRLEHPREWEEAGLRELFAGPGLKLVEWPEKVGALLPPPDLDLTLSVREDDARIATLQPHTATGQAWVDASAQPNAAGEDAP